MAAEFNRTYGYTLHTVPWPEVVAFYDRLWQIGEKHEYLSFRPMLAPVQWIADSPYAVGLFPALSHATLRLVQTPDYNIHQERLDINFHSAERQFYI